MPTDPTTGTIPTTVSTPFRVRIREPGNSAPWLRDDNTTGGRLMYMFGACIDMRLEKIRQGVNDRLPVRRNPLDRSVIIGVPQADALAEIGHDRDISRGLTESDLSYAFRLQRAFDSWRFAGTGRGLLMQILGYLLAKTPTVRFVSASYDRGGAFPFVRGATTWYSYPEGRDPNIEPVTSHCVSGGAGDWNWDGGSPITGSWGAWSGYLVLFSVGAQAWCGPAAAWGDGSAYTPSADGYYSTVSGGAYVLAGSYLGTSRAWGEGSTYTAAASGYYSTVADGAYALAGQYQGESIAWGVDVGGYIGQSIQRIAAQFKSAGTWIRTIVVSFDSALFDPAGFAGVQNPGGLWGQWSYVQQNGTTLVGAYIPSRSTSAVYGGEVI